MKFLVIGLGSMGKRRIRNLMSLGHMNIAGFDLREDRRMEVVEKYNIKLFADIDSAIEEFGPDVFIISTSPAFHMEYAGMGFEHGLACFVEASVVEGDKILDLHLRSEKSPILIAPSCTMRYFAGPKKVKQLIEAGVIGKPLNINYQTGQYLPDWHPWEKIEDFYVSTRATGAGREIVPFELTWLNDIFGEPIPLACVKAKLTDMNADIDDIYHCLLRYPDGILANISVEVISQPNVTRELRIIGTYGELVFSADENVVRYCNRDNPNWIRSDLGDGTIEAGYINPEEPYISELKDFIDAVNQNNKNLYPNTLLDDYHVLKILDELEALSDPTV